MAVIQPPKSPTADIQASALSNALIKPPAAPQAVGDMVPQAGVPSVEMANQPMVNSVAPPAGPTGDPMVAGGIQPPTPVSSMPSAGPQFSGDSNLVSSQINPTAPTATAQNTNYGNGSITAGADPQNSAQFQKYTSGYDNALSNISNGPNRTQLALQKLQDFDTAGQPALDAGFRRVGQQAAKFGRLGAGMTTNDLTGLQGTYDRNKMLLKNDLASSVAEGDINDRYRTADLYGQARGQQYGFGQDQRNYGTGVDQYNQGASFDRARAGNADQANYQDRMFGQGNSNANALRGERDFQTGRSDKAQNDAINQRVLEEQLMNQAFGRGQSQLAAGRSGNPADYLMQDAGQQQDEANQMFGGAGDLLKSSQAGKPVMTNNPSQLTQALINQIYGGMGTMAGR